MLDFTKPLINSSNEICTYEGHLTDKFYLIKCGTRYVIVDKYGAAYNIKDHILCRVECNYIKNKPVISTFDKLCIFDVGPAKVVRLTFEDKILVRSEIIDG